MISGGSWPQDLLTNLPLYPGVVADAIDGEDVVDTVERDDEDIVTQSRSSRCGSDDQPCARFRSAIGWGRLRRSLKFAHSFCSPISGHRFPRPGRGDGLVEFCKWSDIFSGFLASHDLHSSLKAGNFLVRALAHLISSCYVVNQPCCLIQSRANEMKDRAFTTRTAVQAPKIGVLLAMLHTAVAHVSMYPLRVPT